MDGTPEGLLVDCIVTDEFVQLRERSMERIVDADVKLSLSEPFELSYTSETYNSRSLYHHDLSTKSHHRQCKHSCPQRQLYFFNFGIMTSH